MKLFRIRGGVHPDYHKDPTTSQPIERLPLPKRLYIPLQQHIGEPADPVVAVGQHVLKGELLAYSGGGLSAPIHAPTSGRIVSIGPFNAPHPSGLPVDTITLESDGKDEWVDAVIPIDPLSVAPEEIASRVGAAGIVGLGGATFPSAVKLNLGLAKQIHTLIINGAECEPYLTCDDRLMQEQADEVVDGIRIMLQALQAGRAMVAIEDNKPAALTAMTKAAANYDEISVVKIPTQYPMGAEKQMIQLLTGQEVPAGARSADIGVIVHNVATAHAIHRALRKGRPLVSRIVTVSGGAIRNPKNVEVPLGTLVSELLDYCGLASEPARLLSGGPMMGQVLPDRRVPVVKGCNGIIALSAREAEQRAVAPCIRCARCVSVCPAGLMPLQMAAHLRKDDLDGAVAYGLTDCISCGSCSYVCPSNIPLVQYFNYGKGELVARRQVQQKSEKTRKLADARKLRMERQERAKAAALAKAKEARA